MVSVSKSAPTAYGNAYISQLCVLTAFQLQVVKPKDHFSLGYPFSNSNPA
uniref:Uncharacterized protein n=1 Tax=Setaria italica TaxID=4555 RepID=K3YKS4_SETIT